MVSTIAIALHVRLFLTDLDLKKVVSDIFGRSGVRGVHEDKWPVLFWADNTRNIDCTYAPNICDGTHDFYKNGCKHGYYGSELL